MLWHSAIKFYYISLEKYISRIYNYYRIYSFSWTYVFRLNKDSVILVVNWLVIIQYMILSCVLMKGKIYFRKSGREWAIFEKKKIFIYSFYSSPFLCSIKAHRTTFESNHYFSEPGELVWKQPELSCSSPATKYIYVIV